MGKDFYCGKLPWSRKNLLLVGNFLDLGKIFSWGKTSLWKNLSVVEKYLLAEDCLSVLCLLKMKSYNKTNANVETIRSCWNHIFLNQEHGLNSLTWKVLLLFPTEVFFPVDDISIIFLLVKITVSRSL